MDGCQVWGGANLPPTGQANCPPSSTTKGTINPPGSYCGVSTAGWTYTDVNLNPSTYYCPGWAANLQIAVPEDWGVGSVTFSGSGTQFWGVIAAPNALVTLNSPQLELWGAMVAGNVDVKAQFSWHYDEALTSVTTGRLEIQNWREVAVQPFVG